MGNVLIAAYGTLRKGFGNSRLVDTPDSKWIGEGITKESYTLKGRGIPFLSKKPLHKVVIDLWEIPKQNLPSVDRLEGHPEWYKREEVPVIVDGSEYTAWIYFNETNLPIIESGDFKNQ